MKKLWIAVAFGCAAIGFGVYFAMRKSTPELQRAASEGRASFLIRAVGDGQLLAGAEHYMVLRKGGNLQTLSVKLGDTVSAGQVIAVVDETKNSAALRGALSEFSFAGSDIARLQRLVGMSAATAQELDDARSRYATKKAALEAARQTLEDSVARAPVAGVISFLAFAQGDYVPDGSRVAVVEDRSSYQATIRVSAAYRGQLPQKATVSLNKRTGVAASSADGKAVNVEAQIENASPGSDFDALNMDVRCRISTIPDGFALRDLVRVEIPVREISDVVLVEKRAVQRGKGKTSLLVLGEDGVVTSQEVKVEADDGARFVVTGVGAGTTVVLPPPGKRADEVAGKKARLAEAPEQRL